MSFRELRNFTEMMRALGYPRLISMENFRKPNFELVADILYWMVKLYDPETMISDNISTEDERVDFLTDIASLLAANARLKLNTKKLYASDGRAVQELLKLATLLYKANRSVNITVDDSPLPPIKIQEVKAARTLASEITQGGAKLYDLLSIEQKNRQERIQALRFMDQPGVNQEGSKDYQYIEKSLRELIDQTKRSLEDLKKESEEMGVEEGALESKIRKKQEELERTEKRLRSLDNVRPQFMEEQDKLERELQRQYDIYMDKYRQLDYIEAELEKYHKAEEERRKEQEERLRRMREKLLKEEVEVLRGNRRDDVEEEYRALQQKQQQQQATAASSSNARGATKVQGSMQGAAARGGNGKRRDEDEDDESGSDASVDSGRRGPSGGNRGGAAAGRGSGGGGGGDRRSAALSDDDDDDDDGEFLDDDDDDDGGMDDGDNDSGSDEQF